MTNDRHAWISDPATLTARFSEPPARIGLDTEFIRERTYWPQLALVQVAIDDDILLVDPLVPGMPAALAAILVEPRILKVMHSASEDLVAFKHACGVVPGPLFDTQIAAGLAGTGAGLGYQKLVQETLGIALEKGETRSDWLRRPLSPAQLDYAADDVRHLFALHDALAGKLDALDRLAWCEEDCRRMVTNARADEMERWPHLALRTTRYLDPQAQRRLLRLLRWRDDYARDNDRPRTWVLDNELATLLARDPPVDEAGLQRQLDAHPKAPRRLANLVWRALTTPLDDEAAAPAPRDEDRDKQALRRLQDAVAERSRELALPDGVLASRRWLQALLARRAEGDAWPDMLDGWRRAELETALAPLLEAGRPVE